MRGFTVLVIVGLGVWAVASTVVLVQRGSERDALRQENGGLRADLAKAREPVKRKTNCYVMDIMPIETTTRKYDKVETVPGNEVMQFIETDDPTVSGGKAIYLCAVTWARREDGTVKLVALVPQKMLTADVTVEQAKK